MSMWLNLAKVSPDLLREIRADPALLDRLFFEDEAGLPDGVTGRTDIFGCDYRTLVAVAEAMAAEAGADGSDWNETQPWLARATGDDTGNLIEEYEFTYGPAYYFEADEVRAVHEGLVAEGWQFPDLDTEIAEDAEGAEIAEADEAGQEDGDEPGPADEDGDEDEGYEYDDFVDLVPFFAAAVAEGKAIVGGVG